ncbi:hypothetical protein GGTG_03369 [Gaeumannomyces tritici R3-111a-1]|uniref:Uncharacterized protein n=1 Tax=Gaeumannomyces tritici (strain R3-111a-1) TaxID=644352 RepID=J3NQ11_GAET3|nr:hypothetical protein GGTG_03369 [Gaeumannomyces tritici R3-111a-1]EJT78267.1 hypothetical protein GGTG_03369 [Gaeumannomyces tritici R3-111a-1]
MTAIEVDHEVRGRRRAGAGGPCGRQEAKLLPDPRRLADEDGDQGAERVGHPIGPTSKPSGVRVLSPVDTGVIMFATAFFASARPGVFG